MNLAASRASFKTDAGLRLLSKKSINGTIAKKKRTNKKTVQKSKAQYFIPF